MQKRKVINRQSVESLTREYNSSVILFCKFTPYRYDVFFCSLFHDLITFMAPSQNLLISTFVETIDLLNNCVGEGQSMQAIRREYVMCNIYVHANTAGNQFSLPFRTKQKVKEKETENGADKHEKSKEQKRHQLPDRTYPVQLFDFCLSFFYLVESKSNCSCNHRLYKPSRYSVVN